MHDGKPPGRQAANGSRAIGRGGRELGVAAGENQWCRGNTLPSRVRMARRAPSDTCAKWPCEPSDADADETTSDDEGTSDEGTSDEGTSDEGTSDSDDGEATFDANETTSSDEEGTSDSGSVYYYPSYYLASSKA